jgi:hypothetical protein
LFDNAVRFAGPYEKAFNRKGRQERPQRTQRNKIGSAARQLGWLLRLLALEVLVTAQLDRGFGQAEADIIAAQATGWKGLTLDARGLMAVAVHKVMHNVVDSRLRDFLSGSERVADASHD